MVGISMKISQSMLNILGCPNHLDADLIEQEEGLLCKACGKIYEIIEVTGCFIPNFLLTDDTQNWKRGYRGNESKIINQFQGVSVGAPLQNESEVILDVGCGDNARGTFNLDCYIPEKIPKNFILANVEKLPIRAKSVDVITSYYNLEHLVTPSQFILNASRIAKNKVEIITDNSDWVGDVVFRIIGAGRIYHDEHYYKWSSEYLGNLISRLGFSKYIVEPKNLSKSFIVTLVSLLGKIPRIGPLFYRDLHATLFLTK